MQAATHESGAQIMGRLDPWKHPEGDAILEGDEFDLSWNFAVVPLDDLATYRGYLDAEKRDALQSVTDRAAMFELMQANPPLFFWTEGGWKLLDGQHRLTRAHELGLTSVPIAFAVPGAPLT